MFLVYFFLIPAENTYFPPKYIKNNVNTEKQMKCHIRLTTKTPIPKLERRKQIF